MGLDGYYYDKRRFAVYTYNNPVTALSEFKPNFYDLLLTDIYMPHMNGFELCQKVMELDANVKVCFISAAEINIEALREVYPKARSIGCFIKKPVTINYLVKRLCGIRLVVVIASSAVLINQKSFLLPVK